MLPSSTSRLRFRSMTDADLSEIATLDLPASHTPRSWIDWNVRNYAEHGFGLWVVETHEGEFVGTCGLTMQEVEGKWLVEAGWHVRVPLRHQGFATEAAGSVRLAAQRAGIAHLVAIIRPENTASQQVARKVGLEFEREIHKSGGPALLFGAQLGPS